MNVICSQNKVKVWNFLKKRIFFCIRHATGNTEYRAAFHLALHFAEPADHTLFRVIANCARVDEYDIRVLGSIYWPIAGRSKLPKHELGVADVHLAAVRLDVNGGVVRSCHADL